MDGRDWDRLTDEEQRAEIDAVYDEFWRELVEERGELKLSRIKAELFDYRNLLHEVALVYETVTGGRISKPNTSASAVLAEYEDHQDRLFEEFLHDRLQEAQP